MRRTLRLCLVLLGLVLPATLGAPASGHGPDVPDPERVESLKQQARTAANRLEAARGELDAAVAAYENARTALEGAIERVRAASERLAEVDAELQRAQDLLNRRAVAAYRGEPIELVDALLGVRDFGDFMRATTMFGAVLQQDGEVVERVEVLKEEAAQAKADVEREAEAERAKTRELESRQATMMARMKEVGRLLESAKAQLGNELGKFRFPVHAPYSYVDTFGAPRMGGTRYAHSHQGTDIFAPRGTPVVAVSNGRLDRVGWNTLGGRRFWLEADDGHSYYYAHLDSYAPGMRDGLRVSAGRVIGYVGNSGNARTTPPHLHFEIHTPGGAVINPQGTLRKAERVWAEL